MRTFALITALIAASSTADAAARGLTLEEAVVQAMKIDPVIAESRVADDRARLATLRAQLDRFSLKIDGQLQEVWNKFNIGQPPTYLCNLMGTTVPADPNVCRTQGGTSSVLPDSQTSGVFNLQAQLNFFAFSGFRVEANVKRAQVLREASLVQIRQQRHDLAIAVARAYWKVREIEMQREVAATALDRLKEAESIAEARVRAGLAPPIDKNRASSRRLSQVASIEDFNGQLRAALAQLAVTLGFHDDIELTDAPSYPDAPPGPWQEMMAEAQHGRAEVANARLQLVAQHQTVRIQQSTYYPQLALTGLFQYGNNASNIVTGVRSASDTANPFVGLAGNLILGANLTMNFFDTLNTWTGVRDAKYEEARLFHEQRRQERIVESDVRTAHANLMKLYARREPLTAARDVARDNLTIIQGRYKNGDAIILDYLDATIELVTAEQQLADLTAQLQLAWIELDAALGRIVGVNHG